MSEQLPNRGRLRLDDTTYRELKRRILERDGWRCQQCGRRDQLQVHHIVRRSQTGYDQEQNLITLCSDCHCALHHVRYGDRCRTEVM